MSVTEFKNLNIYDRDTNFPLEGGVNDLKMGVTSRGISCQTCFGDIKTCQGHFGNIKLVEPLFHPEFLNYILMVLRSVCYNCSRILLSKEKIEYIKKIKN